MSDEQMTLCRCGHEMFKHPTGIITGPWLPLQCNVMGCGCPMYHKPAVKRMPFIAPDPDFSELKRGSRDERLAVLEVRLRAVEDYLEGLSR